MKKSTFFFIVSMLFYSTGVLSMATNPAIAVAWIALGLVFQILSRRSKDQPDSEEE